MSQKAKKQKRKKFLFKIFDWIFVYKISNIGNLRTIIKDKEIQENG